MDLVVDSVVDSVVDLQFSLIKNLLKKHEFLHGRRVTCDTLSAPGFHINIQIHIRVRDWRGVKAEGGEKHKKMQKAKCETNLN